MTLKGLKTEWSLLPLFGVITVAMSGVVWYCWRLAFRNEVVNWTKVEEPWNKFADKEFKIFKVNDGLHDKRHVPDEFKEALNYRKSE